MATASHSPADRHKEGSGPALCSDFSPHTECRSGASSVCIFLSSAESQAVIDKWISFKLLQGYSVVKNVEKSDLLNLELFINNL